MNVDPAFEYQEISKYYETMDGILEWPESRLLKRQSHISKWSVGQHVVHICMSHSGMWRSIGKILSEKEPAVESATMLDLAVDLLGSGKLERNMFRAPPIVEPPEETGIDEIRKWGRVSRIAFQRMKNIAPALPEQSFFLPHPILGPGNARAWLRMIRIHGEHHLAIIHEIDVAAS